MVREAERRADYGRDQGRISYGGKIDERHAVRKLVDSLLGNVRCEACLADASRADQGDQARVRAGDQFEDRRGFAGPADQ